MTTHNHPVQLQVSFHVFFTVPDWFHMIFYGFSWFQVGFIVSKVPGWFFMARGGILRLFMISGGFFMVPGGFLWFS